jgi:hypothetical protein
MSERIPYVFERRKTFSTSVITWNATVLVRIPIVKISYQACRISEIPCPNASTGNAAQKKMDKSWKVIIFLSKFFEDNSSKLGIWLTVMFLKLSVPG